MKTTGTSKSSFICLILLLLLLSGCAVSGQLVGKLPVIEGDNFATVNICRPRITSGCNMGTRILLDRLDFYLLACGEPLNFERGG
jgi:hypothetical protein